MNEKENTHIVIYSAKAAVLSLVSEALFRLTYTIENAYIRAIFS